MQKLVSDDFSTWPDEDARLLGSSCADCGAVAFPSQDHCPNCSSADVSTIPLPPTGTLVAWTTQNFLPGYPYIGGETAATFEPFGVGLVQLDDVVRVESRLTEADPEKLVTGMDVELTFVPIATDDEGNEILTFAFQPA